MVTDAPVALKGLSDSKQEFTLARLDEIFLSKETVVGKKIDSSKKETEKEFTVVENSSSRLTSKPYAKPKAQQPNKTTEESSDDYQCTLAGVIAFHQQTEKQKEAKQREEEQTKLRAEIWNYLGDEQNDTTQLRMNEPKLSFEELMKAENAKPKVKLSKQANIALESVGKDFAHRRAWGMAPEEEAPTDFAALMHEEKKVANQLAIDEAYA